jgi:hypothetical protein
MRDFQRVLLRKPIAMWMTCSHALLGPSWVQAQGNALFSMVRMVSDLFPRRNPQWGVVSARYIPGHGQGKVRLEQ